MNSKMQKLQSALFKRLFLLNLGLIFIAFCIFLIPYSFSHNESSLIVTDQDIAGQFFPQRLVDESNEIFNQGGPRPSRNMDFVVADLNGVGASDFIIVAYTNGFSGAIRVLRKQSSTAFLVAEPDLPTLGGIIPKVELVDIDNNRRPEVIVSFSSARGSAADWVFKWNGTALVLIGPTSGENENRHVSTLLSEAAFIDLDGDGILEIVNSPQLGPVANDETELNPDQINKFEVFKFDGNIYGIWKSLNFIHTFIRSNGGPVEGIRQFSVSRSNISYMLKILNGDAGGNNRVSSALVRLNGRTVVDPERFGQEVSEIITPVTLQSSNSLSVELRSAPGSQMTITIEPRP
jgi:hypothetical protein